MYVTLYSHIKHQQYFPHIKCRLLQQLCSVMSSAWYSVLPIMHRDKQTATSPAPMMPVGGEGREEGALYIALGYYCTRPFIALFVSHIIIIILKLEVYELRWPVRRGGFRSRLPPTTGKHLSADKL